MSDKRKNSNDLRELKTKVSNLEQQVEAMATGYYELANAYNSLLGHLIARGVVPTPDSDKE